MPPGRDCDGGGGDEEDTIDSGKRVGMVAAVPLVTLLNATFIYTHRAVGWKMVAVHLSPQK